MAKAAGYAATFSFDDLEDLTTRIDEVLATKGPVFIRLAIVAQIENTAVQYRPRPTRTVLTAFRDLPKKLANG